MVAKFTCSPQQLQKLWTIQYLLNNPQVDTSTIDLKTFNTIASAFQSKERLPEEDRPIKFERMQLPGYIDTCPGVCTRHS